jgi:hypothetical protein
VRFIFGFLLGWVTGVVLLLVSFATFIAGLVLGSKIFGDESDESSDKTAHHGPDKVSYHGMSAREETPTP